MNIASMLALAGVSCLIWTAPAAAATAGPPPGSYLLSCTGATVQADALSASCQTLSGSFKSTTLAQLGACQNEVMKGGDIANINGNLVCVPNLPNATGEPYPQSETTINDWVYSDNQAALVRHSWSIWAGLTQFTGKVDGTPVRAFETWTTPSNMIYRIQSGIGIDVEKGKVLLRKAQLLRPGSRFKLEMPHQFRILRPMLKSAQTIPDGDTNIFVTVAYNPAAAEHAIRNKLFLQSTLNGYLKQGYTQIPVFPTSAITIKPVYKIIQKNETGGNVKDGIYTMPGWPGTPSPAKTFPESLWGACVYVDVAHDGPSGSSIDTGCTGRTPATTFHVGDFIHHVITAEEAPAIASQTKMKVSAGDIAILVGMHVTTRETTRWAWQTFWWSANPSSPYLPSSSTIASARPQQDMDAASSHYAMALAYQMVAPAQPINGGKSVGYSVPAYNPHLEAGFSPEVFQAKGTITEPNGTVVDNEYGVQTNCMTCHGQAQYQATPGYYRNVDHREDPYAANFYFGLNDPSFQGKLQLDFAWSILGNLVLDDDGGHGMAKSKESMQK
ncbi:hypothetical protein [Oleiagrimonas soli]|uniref:Cytochrome c domain-containing protein n=1 Tax=Oleiagrimonas soli TaxID=1543381 RepID=A0A099CTU1_9GAMM|nr:hypothetical protein [Oleiagrimonas soli]KGI77081.1 hypothetical protein LF63_0112600 [Oleiagrimonas soli]MBB6185384.1 hypothetical protein [Oleiagrimonas soli]